MAKKNLKKNKLFKLFLIFFLVVSISIGGVFLTKYLLNEINGESKYLLIDLVGSKEIVINYKEKYEDLGAKSSYKDEDLTKKIKVSTDIDFDHIGTYTYKYSVKYKKQNKTIERTVKIVDQEKPELKLKGDSTITIVEGNKYVEKGATATDNYDGDITDKITIDSTSLNTKKVGSYKIKYKVQDSSGNEKEIKRTVKVVEKPVQTVIQKVPVLNYHFFYEKWSENCHESICLNMDKFREQLQYLKDNGFHTLTMDEFVKWMYGEIDIPQKSVLITIDDGAHGTSKINGNHLIPALEKYKMHATLFLITGWDWKIEDYQSPYLEVQSHTHNLHFEAKCGHRSKVNCVSYDELMKDLKNSINVVKDTKSFCFPFYEYTETSLKAVKDSGFKVAFIGGYRKASRNDNKFLIPRYPIYDSTTLAEFKKIVN